MIEHLMAKQKRDNSYYLDRLRNEHPAIWSDFKAGKYPSVRQALIAAGFKNPPKHLNALKNAWARASAQERRDFLALIGASTTSPASPRRPATTARRSVLLDAREHLLPAIVARLEAIMAARRIKMGTVMSEMGFKRLDPALGNAMSGRRPTKVRPDLAKALEKWLDANKGIP